MILCTAFWHDITFLLFLCQLWWLPRVSRGQQVPPIACPKYFQYLNYGDRYIGRITLPNIAIGTTRVDVRLSQQVPVRTNFYGRLSLFQDQKTTISNLERGLPISYRVDFPNPNVLPKLMRIAVNGVDICMASDYPQPITVLDLQHTIHTTTVRGTRPFNSNYNTDLTFPVITNPPYPGQNFNQLPNQNQLNVIGNAVKNPFLWQSNQTQQPPLATSVSITFNDARLQPSSPQQNYSQCGVEGNTLAPFIHGGVVIARGQYPWLAAIYRKQSSGLKFVCGGSLISSSTVVTAAHCFKVKSLSASQVVVYLGRHNLENYSENGVVSRDVRNLLIHPEYNDKLFPDADIAILQMKSPVGFNQYIRPICLWSGSDDIAVIVGQTGFIAGWGADENGEEVTALPKMVDATIVSENECLRSSEVYSKLTTPRTICAGNRDGTGPCMGDSGGGLMISRNGHWTLRGVVSAGQTEQGNCNLLQYVIYCDLAKHIAWLRSNMLP